MRPALIGVAVLALAGCSKGPEGRQAGGDMATYDVEAPPAAAPGIVADPARPRPIAVSLPQIAYSYTYSFRLPDAAVVGAQEAHVALCDRLGPARCQVVALTSGGGEGEAAAASLKLRVEAPLARRIGRALQAAVAKAGGRPVANGIAAEDVSKAIVDTEARLRQRTLLVERLTQILRTRQGRVAELVEAERSVAAAQEEIDQARGWLAELRGRVATSTIEVRYEAVAADPASPRGGLGDAVARSASAFVAGLTAIATLALFLLPWAALAALGWFAWRRLAPRWRRFRPRGDADT